LSLPPVTQLGKKVFKVLADRESKIGKLEETLHQVSQDWSKKLDTMRSAMHESYEQSKKHLQAAIQEIRIQLEEKLQEEKTASEQDISRSEAMQATLKTHLEQVKLQLEGMSSNDPESQLLRESLAEERRKTCALQEQLAKFESDSKANGELCQRQHQDLRAIETLKSQLQDMSEQVPRVETLNTTFNKMVDLNQMMQSTALYLSKERHWVNEQLSTTSQDVGTHNSRTNTGGTESVYFGGKRSGEPAARIRTQSSDTKLTISLSDLSTLDVHSQGERYRRKVIVASPALGVSLTAQPPSITQEQLRRREASIPRSIIRSTASSIQDPESIRAPVNHSQYNRPVSAKRSSMSGFTNPAMVEQIRSGLIQSKTKHPDWEFPTMEDFAKEIHPSGRDDVKPDKKHHIAVMGEVEDNAPAMKRVKSEEPQDDSADVDAIDRHRPLMLRTHHVIRKTYSKKQSD
jgi:acyl carrier protein phosphodiesterase